MKTIRILRTILCLFIFTSSYLTADQTPAPSLIPQQTDIILPRHKNLVTPEYPKEAIKKGIEGKVTLQASIGVNGIPHNIKALTKLGFGFEEAAIKALKQSTFHPATKSGKPVKVTVHIPFDFVMQTPETTMMHITEGEFQMGSDIGNSDEKPLHLVYLDAFYIDKYEVTNAQYKEFINAKPQWSKDQIPREYHDGYYLAHWNGNDFPPGKDNYPVVYVSWYAAMAYAQWAEKRLPTEAEWEKAARGGLVDKIYPWGDEIDATKANYYDTTDKEVTPVGTYPANRFGLYDMGGNVREWCLDGYDTSYYESSPNQNPVAGEGGVQDIINNFKNLKTARVLRGGSWLNSQQSSRVTNRSSRAPTDTNPNEGFRCVKPKLH